MTEVGASDGDMRLSGYVSHPTLRRASGVDQYLFVNRRPVKDRVLVGALRAAYFDVMHAREFPLCCLYLDLPGEQVDVNVSPAKTDVHFLEPSRVRDFIVKTIRRALAVVPAAQSGGRAEISDWQWGHAAAAPRQTSAACGSLLSADCGGEAAEQSSSVLLPLGLARAQIGNKYILSETEEGLIVIDQHAAHERIIYEKLRAGGVKRQPLLIPEIIRIKPGQAAAIMEMKGCLAESGLAIGEFGDSEMAIYEKPADFDLDWAACLSDVADEVMDRGHSSVAAERLHLKLANYACHHSVRAGQKLSLEQMNALLREIEKTERGGQCNHGRPVWKKFSFGELDGVFER
jgi:DNA mismatch repair protein MutL